MRKAEFQNHHAREAARLRSLIASATTPAVKARLTEQAEERTSSVWVLRGRGRSRDCSGRLRAPLRGQKNPGPAPRIRYSATLFRVRRSPIIHASYHVRSNADLRFYGRVNRPSGASCPYLTSL